MENSKIHERQENRTTKSCFMNLINMKYMKIAYKLLFSLILITNCSNNLFSQNIIEEYEPKKNDSIRIGTGEKDFLPFIQKRLHTNASKKEGYKRCITIS